MLEASDIDFAGIVVILELPTRADSGLAMALGPAILNPVLLNSFANTVYESVEGKDAGGPTW